ncbi:MAG TPA: hypothetical protein VFM18_16520, partial [Methanosarcina sp.]|nr:hypothetical protein [Methanosarcina sp.]
RYPGDNEVAYLLHTKNDEEEAERDDMEVVKLYAAPIPSHDTQELIRKAVEEEREACAKICDLISDVEYASGQVDHNQMGWSQKSAIKIRSRSTKEKK